MIEPDVMDSDAPIGASRLRSGLPDARKRPLSRDKRGGMKPFLGAAGLAVIAAGLATVIVQALSPADPAPDATSAVARSPTVAEAPQPAAPAPAPETKSAAATPTASSTSALAWAPAAQPAPAPETAAPAAPAVAPTTPTSAPALPNTGSGPDAPVSPPAPLRQSLSPVPQPAAPSAPVAAAPSVPTAIETGSLTLSSQEVLTSLERGEAKLKVGDIAAARRYFERVALAGDARGATAMGRTYDPDVLAKLPVIGLEPNATEAASWYDRARTLKAGP